MIVQDRYNRIINSIEEQVTGRSDSEWIPAEKTTDIIAKALEAGECEDISFRSLDNVFKFMVGMTAAQYVDHRRMMNIYDHLLQQETYDFMTIVNLSGMSEKALYKKFKAFFNMTPKEAYEKKLTMFYKEPAYWDSISEPGKNKFIQTVEVVNEVTVVVERVDRRPYIVFALFIVAFAIVITCCTYVSTLIDRWGKEYVVYTSIYSENGDFLCTVREGGGTIKPNLLTRRGTLVYPGFEDEYNKEIIIDSIRLESVIWHFNGETDKYTAVYEKNGRISCETNMRATSVGAIFLNKITLFETNRHKEIRNKWDGGYYVYMTDGFGTKLLLENWLGEISIEDGRMRIVDGTTFATLADDLTEQDVAKNTILNMSIMDFDEDFISSYVIFDNANMFDKATSLYFESEGSRDFISPEIRVDSIEPFYLYFVNMTTQNDVWGGDIY